jgi:hypothetical protein
MCNTTHRRTHAAASPPAAAQLGSKSVGSLYAWPHCLGDLVHRALSTSAPMVCRPVHFDPVALHLVRVSAVPGVVLQQSHLPCQ